MRKATRRLVASGFVMTIVAWLTAPAADAVISFNHNETRLSGRKAQGLR